MKKYITHEDPTRFIPCGDNSCIVLNANPDDITLVDSWDPESGEYASVYLQGYWTGSSSYKEAEILQVREKLAEELIGKHINKSVETLASRVELSENLHRRAVVLLKSIYSDIVEQLDADLEYNLFRAHHSGVKQNLDRAAWIKYIQRFLCGVKRKK